MKVALIILAGLLVIPCAGNVEMKKSYWENEIATNTPKGTSKENVEEFLSKSGLSYSYSDGSSTFYTMDKGVKSDIVFYDAVVSVVIRLDKNKQVKSYEVDTQYDGL